MKLQGEQERSDRRLLQWPKQESDGQRQRLFGGKGTGLLDILAEEAHGTAGGTPPAVPPQQTQETLRVRWSGFKRLCASPSWRRLPGTRIPHATAKERPEEDKTEKNLRGTDSTGWRTRAHGVRGAKRSEGC